MDRPEPSLAELTLEEFSERLASQEPVPGGGSASAFAGALAASLLCMVARLSLDRPKYEPYRQMIEAALAAAEPARRRLLELTDADAQAYGRYAAARQLPRETPEQQQLRAAASRAAAREASEVPLTVLRECAAVLELIDSVSGRSNVNAASDLEVAARLAMAAGRGAAANALVNLPQTGDDSYTGQMTAEIGGLLNDMERNAANVTQRVASGELRGPEAA